jgi:hypothetical protein
MARSGIVTFASFTCQPRGALEDRMKENQRFRELAIVTNPLENRLFLASVTMPPNALMVPQTALGSSQLGRYVYVVGAGNKANQRLVTLGPTDGDLVSVVKGVSEGEQIITGNLQKIGPEAPIQPMPANTQSGS